MLKKSVGLVICGATVALIVSGCVSGADGESTFAPIEALQQGIDKLSAVPDDTKASVLEAVAFLLGATGVGGGAAILASKGAAYYRNRGKASVNVGVRSVAVDESINSEHGGISVGGAGSDVGS